MTQKQEPITALYIRVSTEAQETKGFGHAAQIRTLTKLCADRGWTPFRLYDEGAASGASPIAERPQLCALLDHALDGRLARFVVVAFDRLTRSDDPRERAEIIHASQKGECPIETPDGRYDFSNRMDRLMADIAAWTAEWEREHIKRRTMRGKREAVRTKGRWLTATQQFTPFGYRLAPAPDNPDRSVLAVHDQQAAIVRTLFGLYVGGKSAEAVAHELTDRGIPPPNGNRWSPSTTWRILHNPCYKGEARFGDVTVPCPAIISAEQWERAQQEAQSRQKMSWREAPKYRYLLRGLIRCGVCGGPMQGVTGGGHRYYRCARQSKTKVGTVGRCTMPHVRADLARRRTWEAIAALAVALEKTAPLTDDADASRDPFVQAMRRHYEGRKVEPPDMAWYHTLVAMGEMTEEELAWIEEQSVRWDRALGALLTGQQVDTAALQSAADTHRAAVKDLEDQKQRLVRAVAGGQLPEGDEAVTGEFERIARDLSTAQFALAQATEAEKHGRKHADVRSALRDFQWRIYALNMVSGDEEEAVPFIRQVISEVKALPDGLLEFAFSLPVGKPEKPRQVRLSQPWDAEYDAPTEGSDEGDEGFGGNISPPLRYSSPRATSQLRPPRKRPASPGCSRGCGAPTTSLRRTPPASRPVEPPWAPPSQPRPFPQYVPAGDALGLRLSHAQPAVDPRIGVLNEAHYLPEVLGTLVAPLAQGGQTRVSNRVVRKSRGEFYGRPQVTLSHLVGCPAQSCILVNVRAVLRACFRHQLLRTLWIRHDLPYEPQSQQLPLQPLPVIVGEQPHQSVSLLVRAHAGSHHDIAHQASLPRVAIRGGPIGNQVSERFLHELPVGCDQILQNVRRRRIQVVCLIAEPELRDPPQRRQRSRRIEGCQGLGDPVIPPPIALRLALGQEVLKRPLVAFHALALIHQARAAGHLLQKATVRVMGQRQAKGLLQQRKGPGSVVIRHLRRNLREGPGPSVVSLDHVHQPHRALGIAPPRRLGGRLPQDGAGPVRIVHGGEHVRHQLRIAPDGHASYVVQHVSGIIGVRPLHSQADSAIQVRLSENT